MEQILILGAPNSGKSLLFNQLTGLRQKVANFPGITVDVCVGTSKNHPELDLVDYPGIYSLTAVSEEENIAIQELKDSLRKSEIKSCMVVLDGTRFQRGLFLALQVIRECKKQDKNVFLAINMIDLTKKYNININIDELEKELGVKVVPLSAKTKEGFSKLDEVIKNPEGLEASKDFDFDDQELRTKAREISKKIFSGSELIVLAQNKLDRFFLHNWLGGIIFALLMYLVFQSIFTWASPLMDGVESILEFFSSMILPLLGEGVLRDFVSDAIFGGLGSFLVFVPQIFILTLIVGFLEDSGYLARAAIICHKPLSWFGLTGKSFVPMLSGVACAIPGIYAARTIESPFKRFLTYFAIPLMPCSARLPVYSLLILTVIPEKTLFGGLVGARGLAMFGLYFFGIFMGLIVSAVISKFSKKAKSEMPFILEIPGYKIPSFKSIVKMSWYKTSGFVTKAGPIIFIVTFFVWLLGYFPNSGEGLEGSYLALLGKILEPLFSPLGLDWKYGVAIMTSFLAREVFVGTLGTLFGIEGADENVSDLSTKIQNSGLEIGAAAGLLVFFAIAMQCVSTLAVLKKETGSWKVPMQIFGLYSVLAYIGALIVRLAF